MAAKILEASSYNSLLDIDTANQLFINRDEIFEKLGPVLQQGRGEDGCEGENVSQPERDGPSYPERWLATGEAYEFSREETTSPSEELLSNFRSIVGDIKVLGLFYVRSEGIDGVMLERTEDRSNITDIISPVDATQNRITTAWSPRLVETRMSGKSIGVTTVRRVEFEYLIVIASAAKRTNN
ncbi:hypothetical protein HYPSUDRAFT_55554 [Hypholoma sublateritium FD-334 SS-4]|uniref:Uncharacterized protein n=1 Tax=Hypholoma sublateritium (strain FD-334 SS-4) TaxID=945553 RepID=A0A0D2MCS3_HYPSF|nr:hypothetical protein HYPSUDRAFT_55554 [Hypholoma sublateritium FD-334 SS-4]